MTQTTSGVTRSPRQQEIIRAATELFGDTGLLSVSMGDIAAALHMAPSALYRHFGSRSDLVAGVLHDSLEHFESAVDGDDLAVVIDRLVAVAVDQRSFTLLWERGSNDLTHEEHLRVARRIRDVAHRLATTLAANSALGEDEARLRSWAIISICEVPGRHPRWTSRRSLTRILATAAHAVASAPPSPAVLGEAVSADIGRVPVSRKEALLAAAIRLFADRGYPAVGLGDIGKECGIAGPSVYKHFVSKVDLLDRAAQRTNEALWLELHRILSFEPDAGRALADLVAAYTRFAFDHTDLLVVLLTQLDHLPEGARTQVLRTYREYIDEWQTLLLEAHPALDQTSGRLLVAIATGVVNGVARVHSLRRPGATVGVVHVVTAVLQARYTAD